ncbi:hypothetical protein BC628DRAFT_1416504 [Trametes gibbosa]|nr:hypothetical protein BC628DRAFT_1416504 [Trametes gibbosa]
MCGRFSLGVPADEIQALHGYNVHIGEWVGRADFVPRHNIAPRSQAPVIRRADADGPSSSSGQPTSSSPARLMLQTMKWGLVPHFHKHEDSSLKTINARSEALVSSNTGIWASIKGRKRCAVVCEGYYEWLKKGKERLPYFTRHKDGRLMLLAGLWDCAVLEGRGEPLWTFTIVTREGERAMRWLHDRQPVILADSAALHTWLDTAPRTWSPALTSLCQPPEHPDLLSYAVRKEVGQIGTESPTFVHPIEDRKDSIRAIFAATRHKRTLSPETAIETATKKKKLAPDVDDSKATSSSTHPSPLKSPVKRSLRKSKPSTDSSAKITAFFHKQ